LELAKRTSIRLAEVKESLVKLIASPGGRIYALLDQGAVRIAAFDTEFQNYHPYPLRNSEWCPMPILRSAQEGITVEIVNEDFEEYFSKAVDSWSYTLEIESEAMEFERDPLAVHFDSTQGKRSVSPIATNRQKEPISAAFSYVGMSKNLGSNGRGGWNYGREFETGTLVFLPPPTKIGGDAALRLLYETVKQNLDFPLNEDWHTYELNRRQKLVSRTPRIDEHNPSVMRPPFWGVEQLETPLLTSQKDAIFTALRREGLDLNQFDFGWVQTSFDFSSNEVRRILHKPSGHHFTFDRAPYESRDVWVARFSPGEHQRDDVRQGAVRDLAQLAAKDWPRFLKRELDAPDFWAQLASNPLVLAQASIGDNRPFEDAEREELLPRLQSIEMKLKELHGDTPTRLAEIERRMEEIRDASNRVGRKDWGMLMIGQLFTLATTLGLDGEKARAVFDLVHDGLSGLAGLLSG
jgi:hypothetical protein